MELLLIEDNPDHADLLMDAVQDAFKGQAHITWYTELNPALELLKRPKHETNLDICFCDLHLTDSNADETVTTLNSLATAIPIIVLTSLHDEDKARTLIQGGAQDYLSKEDLVPSQLYKTCTYAIERRRQTVLLEERNRDQAAFCYSLSHDFKSPIRRIGTVLKFLKDDLSKRVELKADELEHFSIMENNLTTISALINDLYQYLNLEHTCENFTEVDLAEVIQEALDLVAQNKNTTKITVSALPKIDGNRAQLILLFKNLLDNSIKYCLENRIIHLPNETSKDDRYAIISLRDNGIGMEPEKIPRIFTPFERLHSGEIEAGTGLGLSIVKRIIENHRGLIHITSAPRRGTTVTLSFPYNNTPTLN